MKIIDLGWSTLWDRSLDQEVVRITAKHKSHLEALSKNGVSINCYLSGSMQFAAETSAELPVIGDWCTISPPFIDEMNKPAAIVEQILERKSKISRVAAGLKADEQVLAANIDYVFIVTSVNSEFNVNRLRRFLLIATHGGAEPILVLSKIDKLEQGNTADELKDSKSNMGQNYFLTEWLEPIQKAFPDLKTIATSALENRGLAEIQSLLVSGKTGVFIGSSGVGKSSLVNTLLGQHVQFTQDIGDDDSGKHTTTGGKMFFIPKGGMIIDTAGLREIQVLGDESDLDAIMPEISDFVKQCKFGDCSHETEPGCAVLAAIESGELSVKDMEQYHKLQRELNFQRRKLDASAMQEERRKWKIIHKGLKQKKKMEKY